MVSTSDLIVMCVVVALVVIPLIIFLYCYLEELCVRLGGREIGYYEDEENILHRIQSPVNPFHELGYDFDDWIRPDPRTRNEQLRSNITLKGLDQPTIDSYPIGLFGVRVPEENIDDAANCAICMEKYSHDDVVRRLPCAHPFHVKCIDPWLRKQAQCPVCKMIFT
ncbi:RING-H2 finger protein ATL47-like [Chenopodium quinoa]|uniref:RING-H2 finger protein ATL47-like n=1 Tax=Chenopodium quinoa TaxID=63459 RepID=UPI000B78CB54|nr:RING-H2 finger protein ATL47-like [Chenopodium quinoa]